MAGISDAIAETEDSNEPTAETSPRPERHRFGGVSAVVAAVALVSVVVGTGDFALVQGVVSASAVLVGWYLLPPTYVFALGHVALVALLPEGGVIPDTALFRVVAVEAGLLGVLLAPVTTLDKFVESNESSSVAISCVLLTLGWVFSGGALAWASIQSVLWLPVAGGLLVATTGLAVYSLHRYQLVALGVICPGPGPGSGGGPGSGEGPGLGQGLGQGPGQSQGHEARGKSHDTRGEGHE